MKNLLLLHGAIGAKDQLEQLKIVLESDFKVYSMNFSGHGGEAFAEEFSIKRFASEVEQFVEEKGLEKVSIFGYSMGGYVALYLARHKTHLIDRVITLGTKLKWSVEIAAKEIKMLQPKVIMQKVPQFAEELSKRHGSETWATLMNRTAEMLKGMGENSPLTPNDSTNISVPVLLMLGDQDKMVTLEETVEVFKSLPAAQLAILPSTTHAIEKVNLEYVALLIRRFLNPE